jgi:TLC domain
LAVAVDSDFDQRNFYLKQYFLWQASYHWHSAAFHILSMLILLLHPTKHAPHRFLTLQKGTTLYLRRLLQHALAVALIGIAYIFSSLRRLGAIGLFAFDVSSCCLHLLQLCINAPSTAEKDSRRRRTSTIARLVFWLLVVPSFVLARFVIWPAIWYSATFESSDWLRQLEKTLWPGSAALIRYAIHGLMAALQVLSVIYFHRLFHHDHLRRVLNLGGRTTGHTTAGTGTAPEGTTAAAATPRRLFTT